MSELLLEFLCEELPLWAQRIGRRELNERFTARLKELGFWQEQAGVRDFATPKRLCLVVDGLATEIPPRRERRRGPRKNAPEKAIEGFCKSAGIERACLQEEGDYLYAVLESPGERLGEALARIIPEMVGKIGWRKSMRWGDGDFRFPRPLRSILCLVDGNVVNFEIAGVKSGAHTSGHRFMSPSALKVENFADYEKKLSENKVVLDSQERIGRIVLESKKLAEKQGVRLNENASLLAEIAALGEHPVPVLCSIGEEYMNLPDEVLREVIEGQQKYLTTCKKDSDALAPFCVAVADMEARDAGSAIRRGNERVLRARLADADFFYKRDLEKWKREDAHEELLEDLQGVTFYGTISIKSKVRDMEQMALGLRDNFSSFAKQKDAEKLILQAVRFAKLDLSSEMVREFPKLQGVMGGEYTRHVGVSEAVGIAVKEQYQPQGFEDSIPETELGRCISLSDKLVTAEILWQHESAHPSGAGDPHGLRRAALGIIRILLEAEVAFSMENYTRGLGKADLVKSLFQFFIERLKVYLRQRKNLRPDIVDAVLFHSDDLLEIYRRAEALASYFPDTQEGRAVLKGYKRAANILGDEGVASDAPPPDESLLREQPEKNLHRDITDADRDITAAMDSEDYKRAVEVCARLRVPIDDFFDQVRVNAEDADLRDNRLRLLRQTCRTLNRVADFSRISDK